MGNTSAHFNPSTHRGMNAEAPKYGIPARVWGPQPSHTRACVKDDGHIDKRKYKGGSSQTNKTILSSALVGDKKSVVESMFECFYTNTGCAPSEG